jgi:hypothetical protein
VPTLCVGTDVRDALRRVPARTQSVRTWVPTQSVGTRSHALAPNKDRDSDARTCDARENIDHRQPARYIQVKSWAP